MVTTSQLNENSKYPQDGVVACEMIKEWEGKEGRKLVTIDIDKPWAIETIDGLTQFDMLKKNLVEI